MQALARTQGDHVADALADPLPAGAGVHGDGAAHGARDAHAALQAGELGLQGLVDHAREKGARAGGEKPALAHLDAGELVVQHDDAAVVARVGSKDVGALAQYDPLHALLGEDRDHLQQGGVAVDRHEEARRTADAVGGVVGQALVSPDVGVDGTGKAHVGVEQAQARPSLRRESSWPRRRRGLWW